MFSLYLSNFFPHIPRTFNKFGRTRHFRPVGSESDVYNTQTHTHTLSLSLSLSLTHTHTRTHTHIRTSVPWALRATSASEVASGSLVSPSPPFWVFAWLLFVTEEITCVGV